MPFAINRLGKKKTAGIRDVARADRVRVQVHRNQTTSSALDTADICPDMAVSETSVPKTAVLETALPEEFHHIVSVRKE